ncbi:4-(cytidine 5'-diphospho)-2-C-methyl-D-erythritol kinase [Shewanella oneidensis MR-1]|uniref:4-diphosphocytidyl-2-C-methyl-D-erythritol kinase n=1 Tax=Shewanella oneidensis (strain ATCC 700550 / JCM 31522 / CIP 106686 / LMG 19005 / NCIMB 14063 / MR-1) TaxID=211586 RepID=ISPE_SHEON|nr:4-(cytidine 5'-diphospho)-2-C-methyl-D-erythritol kinase [Shewanella oneidensis]Q8EAR0.1 RecName: Full=4-diphosphocytidyl-2-C-methyl-D-erythritol kinase; Short=CMK; AltName: Full=4-(cytidine-5'-diphospho)-2-C-methyl-D-erythritol kinase [Shewanella oneidensis MR-1]AAN56813.1 4-diphosphocytidyl-2C-methyl-D-erythritol kinase IspE [Shewanella oneidensis MR-1]MDX5998819.1 4-(cytidine 5'-diphospho)-2-C-methyl-D-erythritol kinase [Shewanella oneidensis]MEE2029210.1 4-diphosphocytidyl-2-C-methyl-D-e
MSQEISRNWPAPAKLNLFLHINGRRSDGYHELQTLFQFVDCCDQLDFRVTDTPELILHSTMSAVVADSDNLILRAAKSLQQATGFNGGAEIWLDKRLPMGGGLGGGSSDAATTLVALNRLWNTQLSHDELAAIGLKLGADIPVFIHGFAAFAQGVGERLQAVNPAELWYLVIAPDAHVSTAAVFQDPLLPRNTPKLGLDTLLSQPWANDCQELVVSKYPQVAKALGWLLEYAPSRMTGTGACVFGEFSSQQQALAALAKLPSDMQGFVAKGMNISPLIVRLNRP